MIRRYLLWSIAIGIALLHLSAATSNAEQPNIVVIMVDDLGYGDLGCYGSERFKTPNLDGLASRGIRFTDFHSNGAVCSPTRAALLTGRYQQRTGITGVVTAAGHRHTGLALEEQSFAEAIKKHGYATGMFGKWHLGYQPKFNPIHQGFDEFIGYVSGNVDYHNHLDQTGREDWWKQDQLVPEEGYSTDLITKHGADFIKRHRDQRFLLYLAHEAPHYPYQGRDDAPRYRLGVGREKDPASLETYREMIEVMDEGVGTILKTLEDEGLTEKTIVYFLSDNGPAGPGSAGPLRGRKGSLFEGGHRVPAIACWPGAIQAGQESNETLLGMDLMPTMVSLAGGEESELVGLDGINLVPHLLEGDTIKPRATFWGYKNSLAIREGKYKLVTTLKFNRVQLFDLETDLSEQINLVAEQPEVAEAMLDKLKEWHRQVNAGVDKRS